MQEDGHFLTLCRYVEANARRAKLVKQAELWRWSSLWVRRNRQSVLARWLCPWPVDRPRNWLADVNRPIYEDPSQQVRQALILGVPLGKTRWNTHVAGRLGLDLTLRPRGRPRKHLENSS